MFFTTSHQEVFGHLKKDAFSVEESAEYLEISIPTFRRLVQSGKMKPTRVIGRSQLFSTEDLRKFKLKIT